MVSIKLRETLVYAPRNCDLFPADVYDPNIMFCWGDSGINGFNMLTLNYLKWKLWIQIVVLENGKRPCQFDQGSPLFKPISPTTYVAVGIVSKNLGCGDSEIYETIYTRLVVYYYWMLRTGGPQPWNRISLQMKSIENLCTHLITLNKH